MTPSALRFDQVDFGYAGAPVLQGVDLEVHAGECFGLVGINGAGKSSLIKCLLDFCPLDSGKIAIAGLSHRQPMAREPISFLPERFAPPYYLTGADFLTYMLKLQGKPYHLPQALAILAALDLAPQALDQTVRDYSKGMTQKLGLAACLLADKQIYILDEPMSGLDPKARSLLKQLLRQLGNTGRTRFLTLHALADVEELCDRFAILHNGIIQFVGTPQACCEAYQADNLEQAFMTCIN